MRGMYLTRTQRADQTPFTPTGELTSDNVQDAIVEALNNAVAKPRLGIVTTHNGAIGNNQWLGYDNLLPGNQVPIIVPVNCQMKEITFSYVNASVDGKFQLYKNGLAGGNIVHTVQFTNQDSPLVAVIPDIPFSASDYFVGRWVDEGTNPSDLAVTYFLQSV